MSDFKAKMHQIRFRLGLLPRPRWGSLQRSPRPPSWISGGLLLREVKGGKRGGEGREGTEEGRGGEGWGRGGLPGNVAEETFCLKSAPESNRSQIVVVISALLITMSRKQETLWWNSRHDVRPSLFMNSVSRRRPIS